jgi:hypothetical protein
MTSERGGPLACHDPLSLVIAFGFLLSMGLPWDTCVINYQMYVSLVLLFVFQKLCEPSEVSSESVLSVLLKGLSGRSPAQMSL